MGLSQMLYKSKWLSPFAMQVYRFQPKQKKKPRKRQKSISLRKLWSICISYEIDNATKPVILDSIITCKDAIQGYFIDIFYPK